MVILNNTSAMINCRIGSLETMVILNNTSAMINCRIGSLEKHE